MSETPKTKLIDIAEVQRLHLIEYLSPHQSPYLLRELEGRIKHYRTYSADYTTLLYTAVEGDGQYTIYDAVATKGGSYEYIIEIKDRTGSASTTVNDWRIDLNKYQELKKHSRAIVCCLFSDVAVEWDLRYSTATPVVSRNQPRTTAVYNGRTTKSQVAFKLNEGIITKYK